MNIKTMEGLVGAHTNMNLRKVPMRVYQEARRRGDSGTMERAMGYAGECADKAKEYQAKADKGMEEEAKETKERERIEREETIAKRRAEREMQEEARADAAKKDAGTVEISDEGRKLLEQAERNPAETDRIITDNVIIDSSITDGIKTDRIKTDGAGANGIKMTAQNNSTHKMTPVIQEPTISITL